MRGGLHAYAPLARLADRLLGARGCLLTFHRGVNAADWSRLPNRDFYINLDFLDELLGYLKETGWDVVTIDEAVRRAHGERFTGKFVNVSIDDGYRDTYEAVVPLFRRHDVPVTLFVTTGIPDGTYTDPYVVLDDVLRGSSIRLDDGPHTLSDDATRRAMFQRLAVAWDGPRKTTLYRSFCALNDVDTNAIHWKHAITWDMLLELAHDPLVEIGAHSVSHPHIAALSHEEATREIRGSRERLEEMLGIPVRHFAFPFGRAADCGPRDFQIALESGFETASTTRKGLVRKGEPRDRLPRVTLNGRQQSLAFAELHLNGISALIARVSGRV